MSLLRHKKLALENIDAQQTEEFVEIEGLPEPIDEFEAEEATVAAADVLTQSEADLAQADELADRAEALESAAVVLEENIEESTPGEVLLTEALADLATADTPIDPAVELGHTEEPPADATTVEAAMESLGYTKRKLSQEADGFREMAKRFWEYVKGLVEAAFKAFMDFIERVFSTLSRVQAKSKAQVEALKAIEGKQPTKDKVATGGAGKQLTVNGKAPNKVSDVRDALNEMERLLSSVAGEHSKAILGFAGDLTKGFNEFKLDTSETTLNDVAAKAKSALRNSSIMGVLPRPGSSDARYKEAEDGIEIKMSAPLPGGAFLVAHLPKEDATSAQVRSATFSLVDNPAFGKYESIEIAPFTPTELKQLVVKTQALIGEVAGYRQGLSKQLKDAVEKLKQASKTMKDKVSKENATEGQSANFKDLTRYQVSYVAWASQPMGRLCQKALVVAKAAQALVDTHIAAYPKEKK